MSIPKITAPWRDPRFQQMREATAQLIRDGRNEPGDTVESRLAFLEHRIGVLSLSREACEITRSNEDGARALIRTERLDAILACEGAAMSKALLAADDSELRDLAGRVSAAQFGSLNKKARARLIEFMHPSTVAAHTFELLPAEQLKHVRVTTLEANKPPRVEIVPVDEAPEPSDSVFVDDVPEAISRATALSTWKKSGEPVPELP